MPFDPAARSTEKPASGKLAQHQRPGKAAILEITELRGRLEGTSDFNNNPEIERRQLWAAAANNGQLIPALTTD